MNKPLGTNDAAARTHVLSSTPDTVHWGYFDGGLAPVLNGNTNQIFGTLAVVTDRQTRSVAGTMFADGRPRIVDIKGIRMDAEFAPSMLYVTNEDKPGFVGRFATLLAEAGINIATFHLGRESAGGNAIALVEIDGSVPAEVLSKVRHIPIVQQVKPLQF